MAHFIDFVVDAGVFFDEGVGCGYVGFRLVVVVVADEVFDGVFGEECFEFAVELGCKDFVWGEDEGWSVYFGDCVGDGEGFSGASDAHEDLVWDVAAEALDEFADGLGLVALGFEWAGEFEVFHELCALLFCFGGCHGIDLCDAGDVAE